MTHFSPLFLLEFSTKYSGINKSEVRKRTNTNFTACLAQATESAEKNQGLKVKKQNALLCILAVKYFATELITVFSLETLNP